jgi:acetyl-CoA carboxylase carboxyltransferase component
MSSLFVSAASMTVPMFAITLRKGYGLGGISMAGGSFLIPVCSVSWPTGEFGGMGLEGEVRLGYKKELEAIEDEVERKALFEKLTEEMYERGKAIEAATRMELDAVIDPADTRRVILKALTAARKAKTYHGKRRNFVDTW